MKHYFAGQADHPESGTVAGTCLDKGSFLLNEMYCLDSLNLIDTMHKPIRAGLLHVHHLSNGSPAHNYVVLLKDSG